MTYLPTSCRDDSIVSFMMWPDWQELTELTMVKQILY